MKAWQNIIVIIKGDKVECWGSLTEICKAHKDLKYSTIKMKKFPFTYKGWEFVKVAYRTKSD